MNVLEVELKLMCTTGQIYFSYQLYKEWIWLQFFRRAVVYGRLLQGFCYKDKTSLEVTRMVLPLHAIDLLSSNTTSSWGSDFSKDMDELERIQRRGMKTIK